MKKRILSFAFVLVMLVTLCAPMTALAEGDAKNDGTAVKVTLGSMSAAQGDVIDVPVTIDQNPGIWGINWKIYYDSQILRFDGIEFKDEFASLGLLDTNEVEYPIVINGMGESVTEDVYTTGTLAVIHFKVYVGVALGDTKLTMKADAGNNINVDAEDVELNVNEGVITVTEGLTSSDDKNDYPPEKPLEERQQINTPKNHSSKAAEGGVKWWWFMIGAVVLLAVVVVIWLFSGSDEGGEDDPEVPADAEKEAADEAAFLAMLEEEISGTSSAADDEAAFLKMLEDAKNADEQNPQE